MISAKGICKNYGGKTVLDGVSLSVLDGESAVIVGRNGIGKSTLLTILAGFLRPDAGVAEKSLVAFCPQEDTLFDELTVRDNIQFWQAAGGGADIHWVTQALSVDEIMKKKVKHLSGGMKKCTAICCAISGKFETLILDEPFAGLDIFHKNALLQVFERIKSEGKSILYSSHSMDEITGLDSTIYTLASGKLSPFAYSDVDINLREALLSKI